MAFTGLAPRTPTTNLMGMDTSTLVLLNSAQMEREVNMGELIAKMKTLRIIVQEAVTKNRLHSRDNFSKDRLPNVLERDYLLIGRDDFFKGNTLCLRWRGSRRIVRAHNDYVLKVEDWNHWITDTVQGSKFIYYSCSCHDSKIFLTHKRNSKTGLPVARLMKLVKVDDVLKVIVRWKGVSQQDDTLEPLQNVLEAISHMLDRLLKQ